MINLEFHFPDGTRRMVYDVHPRSQDEAIPLPAGAVAVTIWLGISPLHTEFSWLNDD
jgi:hypothetical protein